MRYFCLATDYDGTIAHDGEVAPSTLDALKRVAASGRKLVLATGREMKDLLRVFPAIDIFDRVIAENGAVLYRPATKESKVLAPPPPESFIEALRQRGVQPLSVGDSIVATWHPHENTVLEEIRKAGLDLQVIFNKEAVMILPAGVNKASGVRVALDELGISPHSVVATGDAENDLAFLSICECGVAVGNALPAVKERADMVTTATHGQGVEEAIEKLLADDLAEVAPKLQRHQILLGHVESGQEFFLQPYDSRVLIAGPSGGGKSTIVTAIVERLIQQQYQVCLIDPEGDYDDFEQFVTLGGPERIPGASEISEVLKSPSTSMSINLLGVPLADRPGYFAALLPRLQEMRAHSGHPHWIVIDEAHHLLPADLDTAGLTVPKDLGNLAMITVHPDRVAPALLSSINISIAIGPEPLEIFRATNAQAATALQSSSTEGSPVKSGEMQVWMIDSGHPPFKVTVEPAKAELRRHKRKYAAGELGEDKSFYFRGPQEKLNLRAQNLNIFAQLAEGVDDDTWEFHLRRGHYSKWLLESIKDPAISEEVATVEEDRSLDAAHSRARVLEIIRQKYTAPA